MGHGERLQNTQFHGNLELDFDTIGFVVLSSVLASIAMLKESVPVLIGAMVLAPSFDPLVAIPFGIVHGDGCLLRRGALATFVLFVVSFLSCMLTVYSLFALSLVPHLTFLPGRSLVLERLTVGGYSIITALAAGAGGALASTSNRQTSIVGVVIALALVPALAAAAVGFRAEGLSGWGGLLLFGVNVLGVVTAGTAILLMRRKTGEEEEKLEEKEGGGPKATPPLGS